MYQAISRALIHTIIDLERDTGTPLNILLN